MYSKRFGPKVIDFVVDTGAKYTCCNYLSIDPRLIESDYTEKEYKLLGGIIEGEVLKVYRYNAPQFTIGTVDMGGSKASGSHLMKELRMM